MCTAPHPAAREAAERFLATNPGDPETYPIVADLEREAVAMLGDVVGLDDPHGYVAAGGTEANLQAVRAARNLADGDANVVAPESVHFSFQKAATSSASSCGSRPPTTTTALTWTPSPPLRTTTRPS
jgi:tyrosine decarboxylase/aspartate 1-decarboxylase